MAKIKSVGTKRNVPIGPVARKSVRYVKTAPIPMDYRPPQVIKLAAKKSAVVAPIRKKKIAKIPSKRFLQFSIPKKNFQGLVRETATNYINDVKFQKSALAALQTAAEDFLIGYFEDAQKCALHGKRKTLMHKDMLLVQELRKVDYKLL